MFRIIKLSTLAAICLAAGLLAVSCIREDLGGGTGKSDVPGDGMTGKARVEFNVTLPSMTMPGTRANYQFSEDDAFYNSYNTMFMLVLKQVAGEWTLSSWTPVSLSSGTPPAGVVELETSDDPVQLILLINQSDGFDTYMASLTGATRDEIEQFFIRDLTSIADMIYLGSTYSAVPMYAEATMPRLKEFSSTVVDFHIIRPVAMIDIMHDVSKLPLSTFEITSVSVTQAPGIVRMIPDETAFGDPAAPYVVTSPSLYPTYSQTGHYSGGGVSYAGSTDLTLQRMVYVSESPALTDGDVTAPCVIIGGKYMGSATPTYYRLDFGNGDTYGEVLRNHKYVFTIRDVTGPGAASETLALTAGTSSMVAGMSRYQPYDYIYFLPGGDPANEIIIMNQFPVLPATLGTAPNTPYIEQTAATPLPVRWKIEGADTWTIGGDQQQDEFITVTGVFATPRFALAMSTRQNNTTGSPRTGRVLYNVGGAQGYIEWTQLSE